MFSDSCEFSVGVCILSLELCRIPEHAMRTWTTAYSRSRSGYLTPESHRDRSEDLWQDVSNMQGTLAGILWAVDVLVTNQIRLDRHNNDRGQAAMAQGTNGSARGQS